jgi:hypothetical protein
MRASLCVPLWAAVLIAPQAFAQADGGLSPEDQKLLDEIKAATPEPAQQPAAAAAAAPTPGAQALNAFSNLFNPAMSANGLLLGRYSSAPTGPDESPFGLELQELELQFMANVDPYFTARLVLAIPSGEGLEVEEGYVAMIPQPLGLGFRAGKIRQAFGRENPLHTHGLPFIERSLVGNDVMGEEGLSEVGLEATWLAPLPWYALFTAVGMDGANEALFGSKNGKDFAGFFALKNVWDLWDDATLEAGVSYTLGNNLDRALAQALSGHLVFKWRPARNARNHSVELAVEGIVARKPAPAENLEPPKYETVGGYAYLQVQVWRGWYLAGRYEFLGHQTAPESFTGVPVETDMTMRQSAVLVFAPTEFSAFRLQVSVTEPPGGAEPIVTGLLQVNFTIGAHPAHAY